MRHTPVEPWQNTAHLIWIVAAAMIVIAATLPGDMATLRMMSHRYSTTLRSTLHHTS